jgi:hypothetical protein
MQLAEARRLINSLQSLLDPLASQPHLTSQADFTNLGFLANKSRDLTLESLQRLTGGLNQISSTTALTRASSLSIRPMSISRTQLNIYGVCENARLYKMNTRNFKELATVIPNTDGEVWNCNRCNTIVEKTSLRLSPGSENLIWIAPVGFFKAHCKPRAGEAAGWTCIWPVVSTECNARFTSEKRLLEHMRDHHVTLGGPGHGSTIHWSADFHYRNAKMCGFGAKIGGQKMQDSDSGFIVPAPNLLIHQNQLRY